MPRILRPCGARWSCSVPVGDCVRATPVPRRGSAHRRTGNALPQFVADYALSLRVDIDAHSTPLLLYKDRGFCLESQAREPVAVVAIRNGEFDRDSDASELIRPLSATSAWYHISVGYFVRRAATITDTSITENPDIHESILAAAARGSVSVPAWMTTAREALKRRAGLATVGLWEKQQGRFTPEETTEARHNVRAQLRTPRTVRRFRAPLRRIADKTVKVNHYRIGRRSGGNPV